MRITRTITTVAIALALIAQPVAALAAGTGDDSRLTSNVTGALDTATEQEYREWLASQQLEGSSLMTPLIIDAPFKYFWTPSHMQEKNYYCGPATVQIIDDYWGTPATQAEIARYLGTDSTKSTDFSKVDDAINHFAGQDYVYYGPCKSSSDFYSRVQYGLATRLHPMAIDIRISGSLMDYYVFDHLGHIVPLEAFDWRSNIVRLNDPYNERDWRPGGGSTGGHKVYPKSQIATALMSHARKAVIY
jgi:type II secretory pathway pseudopilin PulG